MKNPIQIPAVLDVLRTLSDGSIKVTFSTREMKPEDAAVVLGYRQTEGWLLFKPAPFEDGDLVDIPESVPEFVGEKSLSQRLRNVLFRNWEYRSDGSDFETWRKKEMERIISHYKDKLPKETK
jgi:hypothetical protein